jgi:hypothetical protein
MKAEHGSRFSHVSTNAAKALQFFDQLKDFCELNGQSKKLRELLRQINENENLIKAEMQSIAGCWFLILEPLWTDLRKAHARASVKLIDEFTTFAAAIENDSSVQPTGKVYDTESNPFMQSTEIELSSIQANLVTAIRENKDDVILNQSIVKMLQSAAGYMTKLSNKWDRDSVPESSVPFSNQVIILFY